MKAKRGQKTFITPPCLPLACPQARLNHKITKKGGKPLAILLRQGMNNQSIRPTYELTVEKSKCKMLAKAHVLPSMNSPYQNATCHICHC